MVLGRTRSEEVGRKTWERERSRRGSSGRLRCSGRARAATTKKRTRSAAESGAGSEASTVVGRRELEPDRRSASRAVADADDDVAVVAEEEDAEGAGEPKSTRREVLNEGGEFGRRRRSPTCKDAA